MPSSSSSRNDFMFRIRPNSRLDRFAKREDTGGIVFQRALQAGGVVERTSIPKIIQLSGGGSRFVISPGKMKERGMIHTSIFLVRKELQALFINGNGNLDQCFCFSANDRSFASSFAALQATTRLNKVTKFSGFRFSDSS